MKEVKVEDCVFCPYVQEGCYGLECSINPRPFGFFVGCPRADAEKGRFCYKEEYENRTSEWEEVKKSENIVKEGGHDYQKCGGNNL